MSNITQTQLAELLKQLQIDHIKKTATIIEPKQPQIGFFASIGNMIAKAVKICIGGAIMASMGYIGWHAGLKNIVKSPNKAEIEFKEKQIEQNMQDISKYDQHRIAEKQGAIQGINKYKTWLNNRLDSVIDSVGKEPQYKSAGLPIQAQQSPFLANEPMPYVPMPANPFTHKIIAKQMAKPHKIVSLPAPPAYKAKIAHTENDKISDVLKEHELKQVIEKMGE